MKFGSRLDDLRKYRFASKPQSCRKLVQLGSNENNYGPSPRVKAAIRDNLDRLHRYPDPTGIQVREKLAELNGIQVDNILLGNGSDNLLECVFRGVGYGKYHEVISSKGTFQSVKIQSKIQGLDLVEAPLNQDYSFDLDGMLELISDRTALIYLCNPNNPTGTTYDLDTLVSFFDSVPDNIMVVLDEAYYEFTKGFETPSSDAHLILNRFPNVIIARTFSKAYGLAGLRVGYVLAHKEVIDVLGKIRTPFCPNALALIAANAALSDQEYLNKIIRLNRENMNMLRAALEEQDFTVAASKSNFLFVYDKDMQRIVELYHYLQENCIITRPTDAFELSGSLRISVGTTEDIVEFRNALSRMHAYA